MEIRRRRWLNRIRHSIMCYFGEHYWYDYTEFSVCIYCGKEWNEK